MGSMEPRFAIDGPGWSTSFQRRVGAANRGALPYVPLDSPSGRTRVLMPLRAGETLWIAVLAEPDVVVAGRVGTDPLHTKKFPPADAGRRLHVLDAVVRRDRLLPLDSESIRCAADAKDTRDELTLILEHPQQGPHEIAIVPATPELYQALSGQPAPEPSTEQDEYRGWLLP